MKMILSVSAFQRHENLVFLYHNDTEMYAADIWRLWRTFMNCPHQAMIWHHDRSHLFTPVATSLTRHRRECLTLHPWDITHLPASLLLLPLRPATHATYSDKRVNEVLCHTLEVLSCDIYCHDITQFYLLRMYNVCQLMENSRLTSTPRHKHTDALQQMKGLANDNNDS